MEISSEVSLHMWERDVKEAFSTSNWESLDYLLTKWTPQCNVEIALKKEPWIFTSLCHSGQARIVEHVLKTLTFDVNKMYNGWTGMQFASQAGHDKVVKLLVEHGAKLKDNVWEQDSELYLATCYGHKRVTDILLMVSQNLLTDIESRYFLFYCACKKGHLHMVQKWYKSEMDVSKEILNTCDQNDGGNQYPLFAACEGDHYDIAEYLIDVGAKITKDICIAFPEITCHLVRTAFRKSSNTTEQTFEMKELDLEYVESTWFEDTEKIPEDRGSTLSTQDNVSETNINLFGNKLSSLPTALFWELPSLTCLDTSHNPLSNLPLPKENISMHTNSLTCLLISHCELQKLNIHVFQLPNLEELDASHNQIENLYDKNEDTKGWKCHKLKNLNLSNNALLHMPSAVQTCSNMESLNISNNNLSALCSAWQCPLRNLDISNNKLTSFPQSCDQFWADSLEYLYAKHNSFNQIPERIVKINSLMHLDVSYNVIESLPGGCLWSCPLVYLNLSNNKLSNKQPKDQRDGQFNTFLDPVLELPSSCLANSLQEMYLNNNGLYLLPDGICHLHLLTFLDISQNPHLKSLPLELGMLGNLLSLKMEGIKVKDKGIQSMINSLKIRKTAEAAKSNGLASGNNNSIFPDDFIMYLEERRRNYMHHDLIKMVVFGCKNSGSQCFVQTIKGGKKQEYNNEHKTLRVTHWKLFHSWKFKAHCKRDLTFKIWEFPVIEYMPATHPCFLTDNSLYIIVHDAFYEEDNLVTVKQQIDAIKKKISQPWIIVVCIFQSVKVNQVLNQKLLNKVTEELECHYVPFAFKDKASLSSLHAEIYSTASEIQDALQRKRTYLVDRKVPKMFIDSVDKMKENDKTICSFDELLSTLELNQKELQETSASKLSLQEYLLQVGSMLHYNVVIGDLCNLIILDPVWLYDQLNSFMEFLRLGRLKLNLIGTEQVKDFISEKIGKELYPAFISLLEFFNIGMRLKDGKGTESLLIPSLLPKLPPTLMFDDVAFGLVTSRLYCLPKIPEDLWIHVIVQLIPAFERFSNPVHRLPKLKTQTQSSDNIEKPPRRAIDRSISCKGLAVMNKGIQFWRTGIMVWHDQGFIVVEEVQFLSESHNQSQGILVTVKTRSDPSLCTDAQYKKNLKELAVIGVVTDELEQILEDFDSKLKDILQDIRPLALCPHCHKEIRYGQGTIDLQIDHFDVKSCAQRILWKDIIYCDLNRGKPVFLNQLIPEFMFLELPSKFYIPFESLEVKKETLGQGMAGTVKKGRFKDMDVALKLFYTAKQEPVFDEDDDPIYGNIKNFCDPSLREKMGNDNDEEEEKIFTAFMDLRREASTLSKLRHKCIIDFLGVCVKRQLVLVLELAPLGSFSSQLTQRKKEKNIPVYKPSINEPITITQSIFGKDLSYKILLQISSGLSYLHSQNVIFRDLKPDNILVISLDLAAEINIKVSDYGISKFSTSTGVFGMAGTLYYMAPEVLANQTYTNKVDVYSLGILMFETLTGVSPADVSEGKMLPSGIAQKSLDGPPHSKLYKVNCNFPTLESLMVECWAFRMNDRPSIKEVMKRMSSDQFLLMHDVLWSEPFSTTLKIACIFACQSGDHTNLWISESDTEGTMRYLSVFDLTNSVYTIRRKEVPGSKVTSMAKIRDRILFFSEGSRVIEEIVCSTQNDFVVRQRMILEQEISSLTCHNWRPSKAEEDHSFILIGHTNGTITTSHIHKAEQKTVSTTTEMTLDTDYPISNIVTVKNDSLIASSGHTIFFLVIQEQTSGDGVSHPSVSLAWSYSFFETLNITRILKCFTIDKCSLWCTFVGKNQLIKFNWEEQKVEENLYLLFNAECDLVDILVEKASFESFPALDSIPNSSKTAPRPRNSVPPRKQTQKRGLRDITSLCIVSNLLAVGTDCGGLILMPISRSIHKTSPLQLPMLRHPQRIKNLSRVKESSDQNLCSVSKIIQTGEKLISLLRDDSEMWSDMKAASLKERGKTLNQSENFSDFAFTGTNTLGKVQTQKKSKKVQKNKFSLLNAELVVWDDVSERRLDVMKTYRNDFVECE